MAARRDSEALEKRIRAVYDAFDIRNYKGAIKLANAGIQKYPDCHVFRSLKAVALERTGKLDEALQAVQQVLAAAPPDDHVLNMLLLVLKPANRTADLLPAYEAAFAKAPHNEELAAGLFACHVRSFSFREQQQLAMRLNKQHPNEAHQWWVVVALALQAHAAAAAAALSDAPPGNSAAEPAQAAAAPPGGLGADKLLQLAEAMAARLLAKSGAGSSWEGVMLYLGLLQAQGKYDAALEALRGPLGGAISLPAERREAEAALLHAKGDLAAAAQLYQAALQEQPDDWALLLLFLDCLLPGTACSLPACSSTAVVQMLTGPEASAQPGALLGGLQALVARLGAGEPQGPSLQERLAQAEACIGSLRKTAAPSNTSSSGDDGNSSAGKPPPLLRGPALAAVELAKRKLQLGLGTQQVLADALLAHHDQFGHMVSCAMDVRSYLGTLDAGMRAALGRQLAERADQAAADLAALQQQPDGGGGKSVQLSLLRRQISARQVHADLGGPAFSDAAAAQAHAQRLLAQYAAVLPLSQGLDERERGPADELLWLAAAALMAASALQLRGSQQAAGGASGSAGMGAMLSALLVLAAAAQGRPYCGPVQLGLTGLCGLLGNARGACQHFGIMEVKHIQHDTLSSHHLLPLLLALRADGDARELLEASAALFEDHLRDAGDTLMQAYRAGTHTKVLEFVCFKGRLERSHTYVLARAERVLLDVSAAAARPAAGDASAGASAEQAAAAAAAQLPLQLLDSPDWAGMRFNDDLNTRLPWLPPIAGPRHLSVLHWWEAQLAAAAGPVAATQQPPCWWQQVSAAEADLPQAAALRAATKAATEQRWLLPHLLTAALQAGAPGSAAQQGQQQQQQGQQQQQQQQPGLAQLLPRYAAALGCASVAALEQEVCRCFGTTANGAASSAGSVPASRQLQLLDAALFTLAADVTALLAALHDELAGGEPRDVAPALSGIASKAGALAAGAQQLAAHAAAQLAPSAAYLGVLLPGHALSLAALTADEGAAWATCALEAWCRAVKHARKRKPKRAPAQPLLAQPGVAAALQQLERLAAGLAGSLEALAAGAAQLLATPEDAAAVTLLAAHDPSSDAALAGLVGWEPRLGVQGVLQEALRAQRSLAARVQARASALARRLAAVGAAGGW